MTWANVRVAFMVALQRLIKTGEIMPRSGQIIENSPLSLTSFTKYFMRRKINVSELKPGMYISDLGLDWFSHGFFRSSFVVTDEAMVRRVIASGMHEVYIDPARGLDAEDAQTDEEVAAEMAREMVDVAQHLPPARRITASEEMPQACVVTAEAGRIVREVMNHARLGLQVKAEQIEPTLVKLESGRLAVVLEQSESSLMTPVVRALY